MPSATPSKSTCPRDTLKLGVCANLVGGLIGATIGTPPRVPCCTLIEELADVEAALCLCTALKANILGINLNVPISLSLLLNVCSKMVPSGFQYNLCALEARGNLLATVVNEQAERDGHVEVDAQDIGFKGSA
ncbi:hypothetical protein SASPL_108852 [Salvia splendens]|uniref:Bifunctional inhibitor/plant lipid transfer protein/seed storage helical domain-containing protein n=1 Tax=Salvia splendens TaxID=180675 RepID=A0A8X8YG19_SALSN|nr:hypothetical protein SASPL_108852 [Salvia splendens]